MDKLDPHKLFSIFEANDEEVYQEHNVTELLDNPYVIFGMVLRGVENFFMIDMMYKRNYPDVYKDKAPQIKLKYFIRLVNYLERIDLHQFDSIYKITKSYPISDTLQCLDYILKYFEEIEYYEYCAVVKRYYDAFNAKGVDTYVSESNLTI